MNKLRALIVLVLGLWVTMLPMSVYANSNESAYSVSADIPDFQVDKNLSYFDLHLQPNQQKTIKIHLANTGKEKAAFLVNVNNAATNSNGVIDYGKNEFKKDPSAKYELNQLVKPKTQEVELPAGKAEDVQFQITMPKTAFKGIVLGGIHVSKKDDISQKAKGTAIRNKYAYVIGVKLQNSLVKVTPDLKLKKVNVGLQNSYTTIFANIQNPTATIISKVAFDAKVTKKDSNEILYETKKENLSIAPNTNFDFPIGLNKDKIAAGNYTVTIDAKEQGTTHRWHMTSDLTIKADKANKLNHDAVTNEKGIPYLSLIIGIGLFLVLIILFLSWKLLKAKR
ncbi:DUF916 and DUF3324 domain-containing protein [Enterococcus hirae]|uniref:DUF916 and DUF3324 domain-containing protein n=1 Tax=Enterococcus hirae TaxID=1354 RepID=UPI0015F271AD|nr:DUF916 and DUF3324 domain-containing protein [Enterococcus hirae]MBA5256742.1 DUF916 and DUF3324 domain-containing protein [Enterococcus hirae]